MTQLQINSPEMQDIFETKFHTNQEKFMEFITSTVMVYDIKLMSLNRKDFKYLNEIELV